MGSDELKSIIHLKLALRITLDSQYSSAVRLEKCRTTLLANTLFSMTSREWNSFQKTDYLKLKMKKFMYTMLAILTHFSYFEADKSGLSIGLS